MPPQPPSYKKLVSPNDKMKIIKEKIIEYYPTFESYIMSMKTKKELENFYRTRRRKDIKTKKEFDLPDSTVLSTQFYKQTNVFSDISSSLDKDNYESFVVRGKCMIRSLSHSRKIENSANKSIPFFMITLQANKVVPFLKKLFTERDVYEVRIARNDQNYQLAIWGKSVARWLRRNGHDYVKIKSDT